MIPPPKGELAFQVSGGPFDGERTVIHLLPDRPVEERGNPFFLVAWSNTRGGEVGRWFCTISPGLYNALCEAESGSSDGSRNVRGEQHWYEVVRREEDGDDVTVYCEYRGTDGPPWIMRTTP